MYKKYLRKYKDFASFICPDVTILVAHLAKAKGLIVEVVQ
jgi:hypothetical protein